MIEAMSSYWWKVGYQSLLNQSIIAIIDKYVASSSEAANFA